MATKLGKAYKFGVNGAIEKVFIARDKSHAIRAKKSKKQRPVSKAKALSWKP